MTRQILTLDEVSEETRIPVATLRYYRATAQGPRLWKLGGRIVAYKDDVEKWIDAQYAASIKEAV